MFHDAHPDRLAHLEAASGSGILNVFGLCIYPPCCTLLAGKFSFHAALSYTNPPMRIRYATLADGGDRENKAFKPRSSPPQGTDPRLRRSSYVIFADRNRSKTCTLLVQKSSLPIGFLIESHVSYAASQVSVPLLFFV